jgi:hypothetical protein
MIPFSFEIRFRIEGSAALSKKSSKKRLDVGTGDGRNIRHFSEVWMFRFLIAPIAILLPAFAHAEPAADAVMQPVAKFVAALNAGDEKAAAAAMTARQSITDEFAPFHWEGSSAVAAWFAGDAADTAAHGVTDGVVSIDKPLHETISGTHAYVVVPMTYAYKAHGKKTTETALFTTSLEKSGETWLMNAWAYGLREWTEDSSQH